MTERAQYHPVKNFQEAARLAEEMGGTLRLNKKGELLIKGTSFLGKAALWLKENLFPHAARRENLKVLHALERLLNKHYKVLSHQEIERSAHHLDHYQQVPRQVADLIERFDAKRETSLLAGRQALEHFADRALGSKEKADSLFKQAGRKPQPLKNLRFHLNVGDSFKSFAEFLLASPRLNEGYIPSMKADDKASNLTPQIDYDGKISKELLDATLVTTLKHQLSDSRTSPPLDHGEDSPHFSTGQMAWLHAQYDDFLESRS